MVFFTYSQPKLKPLHQDRIKTLWKAVVTRSTPDLWVKVLIRRREISYFKAYYFWKRETWYNGDQTLNYREDDFTMQNRIESQKNELRFWFGDRYNFEEIEKQRLNPNKIWSGNYRSRDYANHGFYDKEWTFLYKHSKVRHVITLKIGEDCTDRDIMMLMAHEYRHYLQYKKHKYKMGERSLYSGKKKRPIQVERDANKWMKARVDALLGDKNWLGEALTKPL